MPKPNKLTPNNGWYDPADYITVHEDYLEGMRAASACTANRQPQTRCNND